MQSPDLTQTNRPLRYQTIDIIFQEVPGEVSLAIGIAGCKRHCQGCHSKNLWEDKGDLLLKDLPRLIDRYNGMITCVCFMGGDQNENELISALQYVKQQGLKTCLYSGADMLSDISEFIPFLDYVKIGKYIADRGGLSSETTNQRFIDLREYKDITNLFWRKHEDS